MGVNEFIKIGSRIKELRISKKISQKAMAEKLNINRTTYSNYENDNREPNFNTICKIAEALNVSAPDLFSGPQSYMEFVTTEVVNETISVMTRLLNSNDPGTKKIASCLSLIASNINTWEIDKDSMSDYKTHFVKLFTQLTCIILNLESDTSLYGDKDEYLQMIDSVTDYMKYKLKQYESRPIKDGEAYEDRLRLAKEREANAKKEKE